MPGKVLIVDDDRDFCETVELDLRKHDIGVETSTSSDQAFRLATTSDDIDVAMVDLVMPGLNGIDLCRRLVANRPDLQVIAVTAFGSLETAIEAIRAGVHDFVTKPVNFELLRARLQRALSHRSLQRELRMLQARTGGEGGFQEFVGTSDAMRTMYEDIDRAAAADATVLITGESGTGKELVARALHARGTRRDGPFVAINCAALPETLMESELFGHARGAFTDARSARAGIFKQAHGGTVFLDEVGDMPLALQPKLLRALEERVVRPVGGDEEISFDARVVAATNRDLELAVDEGRFREDLFYRVNVIRIEVPPLRRRGADILLLARHFVRRFARRLDKSVADFTDGVAEKLMNYAWPGNVRELRNAMERAVALTRFEELIVEDLPERIRAYRRTHLVLAADDVDELVPLEEVERRYILRVLESVESNKALAARILGVDRKTLYRKLERYGEGAAD